MHKWLEKRTLSASRVHSFCHYRCPCSSQCPVICVLSVLEIQEFSIKTEQWYKMNESNDIAILKCQLNAQSGE